MVGVKITSSSKDFYFKGKGELVFFSDYYEKQSENWLVSLKSSLEAQIITIFQKVE